MKNLEVEVKGPGPGRESAVRALNNCRIPDHQHHRRDPDTAQWLPAAEETPRVGRRIKRYGKVHRIQVSPVPS